MTNINEKSKLAESGKLSLFLPPSSLPKKRVAVTQGYQSPYKKATPGTATAIPKDTNQASTGIRIFTELWNSLTPFTYSSALLPYLVKIGQLETAWTRDSDILMGKGNKHLTNFQLGTNEYAIAKSVQQRLVSRDPAFSAKLERVTQLFKNTATAPLVQQLGICAAWFQNLSEYVTKHYSLTGNEISGPPGFKESPMYPAILDMALSLNGTPFKRRLLVHVFLMACIHRFGAAFFNKERVLKYPRAVIGLPPITAGTPSPAAYTPPSLINGHKISDYFGVDRPGHKTHKGIDVAAPLGTALYAPFPGTITKGTDNLNGNWVAIKNPELGRFKMIHLDSISPKLPTNVQQGTVLGTVGKTGSVRGVTGVHLHLTYMKPGSRVESDPLADANLASVVETIFDPNHAT